MLFMIERVAAGIDLGTIRPQLRSKSMRSRLRSWPVLFLFTFSLVLIPSGRLLSQQPTGKPSPTESIDQLTAPIALYPDALIFQIMPASTNIEKVKSFAAWLGKNAKLEGERASRCRSESRLRCPVRRAGTVPTSRSDDGPKARMDEGAWPGVHSRQECHLRFGPANARSGASVRQFEVNA